jgi:hypothetical protein
VKIFLAGGTGFLGQYLCRAFIEQGYKVTVLARAPVFKACLNPGLHIIRGDPSAKGAWQEQLAGHEAVVNLAGASIFQRWTRGVREEILKTRVLSTSNIVDGIRRSGAAGATLFNASGVGYYGACGKTPVDEGTASSGNTFLARVASEWEQTALKAEDGNIRVVLCRLGIVLGRYGGAFPRLLRLTRFRLCAPWGNGEQWFSWIHEKDVARIFSFLFEHMDIRGPVNFSSPAPVKNREMANILNDLLKKTPVFPAIPAWILRSILGEFSQVFLIGQRALPGVLTAHDFSFQFPFLREATADLSGRMEKHKA